MRLAALALVAPMLVAPAAPATAAPATAAPGAPGALSHFGLARKDCVGTATGRTSKVWYTVAGGVLSDVYSPTIDNTNVETMQFVVTDGRTFTDLQSRDTTYTVRALDRSGMSCEVTSTARNGRYRIVTRYVTDPRARRGGHAGPAGDRATIWIFSYGWTAASTATAAAAPANGGADSATVPPRPRWSSRDPNTATNAVNRDYAVPTSMALRADRPFLAASSGFAGTPSDGLTQLSAEHRLTDLYRTAEDGNVVQTAKIDHGTGRSRSRWASAATPVRRRRSPAPRCAPRSPSTAAHYQQGWRDYDASLRTPPGHLPQRLKRRVPAVGERVEGE